MNIVSIIPARGGSKGIPDKNLIDINGKPLVAHSIICAKDANLVNNVYVTSDSDEILKIANKYGAYAIKRPDDISGDYATTEDAIKHAINKIEISTHQTIDVCVYLQPTSPLRDSLDIDNAINVLLNNNYDSVFSGSKLEDFLIWKEDNNGLTSVNYDHKNRKRRQDHDYKQFVENGSIYVFYKNVVFDFNNRFGKNIGISQMEFWKSFEIDSLDDLEMCRMIHKIKMGDK